MEDRELVHNLAQKDMYSNIYGVYEYSILHWINLFVSTPGGVDSLYRK